MNRTLEKEDDFDLIRKSYRYCQSVTRTHAKSFYFAAKFLPRRKRLPVYALYALCRHVDDEVDEAAARNELETAAAVRRWREKLERIYGEAAREGGGRELRIADHESRTANDESRREAAAAAAEQDLVFVAWRDLLKTYKIPLDLPLELMKGVLMDTHVSRYDTFDELYVYCYRVASTVGLMSSEIFGYESGETLRHAEALGIAMQLTNILRDVKEDALMGRIYLPQEDLRRFGVSESEIFENRAGENFTRLMRFEIERARSFYRTAERGIPLLEKDTRFTVLLAARLYGRILDEIELQNYDVFARRAYTSLRRKIFSIPRIWLAARRLR